MLFVVFAAPPASASAVYNAAADFSNSNNPNGAWSYCADDAATCSLFTVNSSVGGSSWGSDFSGTSQSRWSDGSPGAPAIALSNGTFTHDVPSGDVFGHSQYDIRWTAPQDGVITITGGSWMTRDLEVRRRLYPG